MASNAIVASFLDCWRVQDLEAALAHLDGGIVYTLHNGPDAWPFSGSYRGIESCRELGRAVLAEFDYLSYEPTIVSVRPDDVQAHIRFRIRHRSTGHAIEGTQRSVFRVRDGRIVAIDIFEDAALIEAFMKLLTQQLASGAVQARDRLVTDTEARSREMMERIVRGVAQRQAGRR